MGKGAVKEQKKEINKIEQLYNFLQRQQPTDSFYFASEPFIVEVEHEKLGKLIGEVINLSERIMWIRAGGIRRQICYRSLHANANFSIKTPYKPGVFR